jgi:hypothetical protein
MKKRQFVLSTRRGDLLIFWQVRTTIHLEGKYGEITTNDALEFLDRLEEELESGELTYIGDL